MSHEKTVGGSFDKQSYPIIGWYLRSKKELLALGVCKSVWLCDRDAIVKAIFILGKKLHQGQYFAEFKNMF